jgi:hypothetical protein
MPPAGGVAAAAAEAGGVPEAKAATAPPRRPRMPERAELEGAGDDSLALK